jgi:hypothetical protein
MEPCQLARAHRGVRRLSAEATPAAPRGGSMHFRKSNHNQPRLPKDSAARQGDITRIAFSLLGGRDGALAFLNGTNDELGGRPIDLATASDEGYAAVEQAIRRGIPERLE